MSVTSGFAYFPQDMEADELWNAARDGDVAKVRQIVEVRAAWAACGARVTLGCRQAGADVNQAVHDFMTPLWIACRNGHVACARLLVECGADVDQGDRDGWTSLCVASPSSHDACV